MNPEAQLKVHLLELELKQIIENILSKYKEDDFTYNQLNEYLEHLVETLKFFNKQGNYDRMQYDLCHAIAFLPLAFPI